MSSFLASAFCALATAFLFAVFNHLLREGLKDSSPRMAILVPALVMVVVLGLWTSLVPPRGLVNLGGVFWLILAGIAAPGLGRPFLVLSLDHLGVARSAPIVNSNPLAVIAFAVFFMGERPGMSVILGMLAIVGGVVLITSRGPSRTWEGRHLLYPIGASVFFGAAIILGKLGMNFIPHPVFGSFLRSAAALPFFFLLMPHLPIGSRRGLTRRGGACFAAAGAVNCLAFYFYFEALRIGDVSVVTPLIATIPLFNLILVYLFLRYLEPLNRRIVAGTFLTVLGTVAMLVFQGR